MKIAVYGTGPIGSTFAFQLARHGHDVTVIARGKRLEQLQADGAIVTEDGQRATVQVSAALDPNVAFDLVLVTVLAHQVDAVLPALRASSARTVMFMFNTFASLSPLRDAVGAARFAFGFPAILATLTDGKLKFDVYTRGQKTLATDTRWATTFTESGIPTDVQQDMESWLRTHAVLIVTMMSVGIAAHAKQAGVSWEDAKRYALAMKEGFRLVRRLGNAVTPAAMVVFERAPASTVAGILWAMSRTKIVRGIGAIGPAEPRALLDAMVEADPANSSLLQAIRP